MILICLMNVQEAMPVDSGWYWCDTDFYQFILYVDIKIPRSNLFLPSDILSSPSSGEDPGHQDYDVQTKPPTTSSPSVLLHQKKGTADQMQVYGTYQNKWQDKQVIPVCSLYIP